MPAAGDESCSARRRLTKNLMWSALLSRGPAMSKRLPKLFATVGSPVTSFLDLSSLGCNSALVVQKSL